MGAIIAASGSLICSTSVPVRLDQARDQPLAAEVPQRDARKLVLAVVAARPPGQLAAVAHTRRRRVARKLGELERRGKPLLHRLVLVARNRLEPRTPARIFLAHLAPPLLLFHPTFLRPQYLLTSPPLTTT